MGTPAIETPTNARGRDDQRTVVFPAQVPTEKSYQASKPKILLFGSTRPFPPPTLEFSEIAYSLGAADDTCMLRWNPDISKLDAARAQPDKADHIKDILDLLDAKTRVLVYIRLDNHRGAKRGLKVLFAGYPLPKTVQWSDKSQSVSITCVSEGQLKARHGRYQQILGRLMRKNPKDAWDNNDPDMVEVTTLAPIFNAGGRPNRSADRIVGQGGHLIYYFAPDDDPEAEYWNYADALRYVVYWYCLDAGKPIEVDDFLNDTSGFINQEHSRSLDAFERDITRRVDDDASIQSSNLDSAIAILTDAARLHYQIGIKPGTYGLITKFELRVVGYRDSKSATVDDDRDTDQPEVMDLPRDTPFTDYTNESVRNQAEDNACNAAMLTIDDRPIREPIFLAGHETYEATFLLRPGWRSHYKLDDRDQENLDPDVKYWRNQFDPEYDLAVTGDARTPRSIYHSEHPDHHTVADVFRLWIFPDSADIDAAALRRLEAGETGPGVIPWVWYEQRYKPRMISHNPASPLWYAHAIYGGGLPSSKWVPRSRPFRETIGRMNAHTSDRTPIVRIHFGNGTRLAPLPDDDGWRVVQDLVEIDEQRAAIRFTEANIFNGPMFLEDPTDTSSITAIQRYLELDFWVSVTATVRGDKRMRAEPFISGAQPLRSTTVDLGFERFRADYRERGNSYLAGRHESDPKYKTRDDSVALRDYAARVALDMNDPPVAGFANIFWLTADYKPGDVIKGINGLSVNFRRYPIVKRVAWTNAGGTLQTTLMLTDLRENPEVAG